VSRPIEVALEIGTKRVFASALEWPGWCRAGRDEEAALEALVAYGARYGRVVKSLKPAFRAPSDTAELRVLGRLDGNATTDFGAPGAIPASDERPIRAAELHRLEGLQRAAWKAFDDAAESASRRTLRPGPRGGGRSLDKIVAHVLGAEEGYLRSLGGRPPSEQSADLKASTRPLREAIIETIEAVAPIGRPEPGPRGGTRWPARYFIRRSAWHVLDHAWEIEDRTAGTD
jgi:hypothetical protein